MDLACARKIKVDAGEAASRRMIWRLFGFGSVRVMY
jgi:hypothetical protein